MASTFKVIRAQPKRQLIRNVERLVAMCPCRVARGLCQHSRRESIRVVARNGPARLTTRMERPSSQSSRWPPTPLDMLRYVRSDGSRVTLGSPVFEIRDSGRFLGAAKSPVRWTCSRTASRRAGCRFSRTYGLRGEML